MSDFDDFDAFEQAARPLSQQAMAARPRPYLDGLNPEQRAAVEQLDGPVLMLAGAGTGKTRALTARIAHLLNTGTARPNEVLAVTFTNKAAREMKDRVGGLLGQTVEGMPWMGTFHALSVKLLRRHAELVGLKSSFTILDTDDQLRLLKQVIQAANIDEKRWPARQLSGIIDHWKNRAWRPDTVPAAEASAFNNKGIPLYAAYQKRLIELNACDFGDLLLHVLTMFQQHPDILAQYQRWFRYILVDEYQDTNVAQYMWLRLLAAGHKNICCVGDDDQSIYGWRGAEVGNILRFEKDFPGAHVVRLEQNYRSTEHILAAASGVIAGNEGRLGKTLWTAAKGGEKVRLIGHWDGEEEARWIGEEIEAMGIGRAAVASRRQNLRTEIMIKEVRRLDGMESVRGINNVDEVLARCKGNSNFSMLKENRDLLWELTTRQQEGLSLEAVYQKFDYDEIAILVRASHQMRAFEDRFLSIGLPYRVIGGPRFYERMEIRDAMAYFRLVVSPDDDLAFERVVNTPKRGLGDKATQKIQEIARNKGLRSLAASRVAVQERALGGKGLKNLSELVTMLDYKSFLLRNVGNENLISDFESEISEFEVEIERLLARLDEVFRELVQDKKTEERAKCIEVEIAMLRGRKERRERDLKVLHGDHIVLAEDILDESGYTTMWQNDKTPEAPGRLDNLKELVKALEQFENLQGFLEHVALVMENDQGGGGPKVSIMTLHAAKGLEFPAVFLPGWEDGLFPSQRSMDESGLIGLEEERRLAYVGITRAEEVCTISFAGNRRVYGQWQSQMPSRFVDELPPEHVEVLTPPGLYGGEAMAASQSFGRSNRLDQAAADANVYNSPGWRRLQSRQGQRPMAQPKEARNMVIDGEAISAFALNDRVFHQKFGNGEVIGIEGEKLEVDFDHAGVKHVVARFLKSAAAAAAGDDDVPF